MDEKLLDDFETLSGWTAVTSGQAQLRISQDRGLRGKAMRLDFDFRGGGGFVVARKLFPIEIPEACTFGLRIRGLAPRNALEFKLVDGANENVWRYRVEAFDFPQEWQPLHIRSSQIDFAWGPLGGGPPGLVAAVELVIAAGPGGMGTVWIDELWLRDDTYRLTPVVRSSSSLPGHDPQKVVAPSGTASWRSKPSNKPQWLLIDFQKERKYGGLVIQWVKGFEARQFDVQVSSDGADWITAYGTSQADTGRSYVYLPQGVSRYIRLNLRQSIKGRGFAIRHIEVKPYDFSRTINHFFQNVAREAAAGLYPKYFLGLQTYWTIIGTGENETQALMNEEGMVEVDKGSFSIEPFLYIGGRLVTWADVNLTQELRKGYLPLPSSQWQTASFAMKITAFATGDHGGEILFLRYRIENRTRESQSVRLFTALRPFQVTPTWQNWRSFGGVDPIREMSYRGGAVRVNGNKVVVPLEQPAGFGVAPFAAGGITKYLPAGECPPWTEATDDFNYASGALRFDLDLEPGAGKEVFLAVPFGTAKTGPEGQGDPPVRDVSGPGEFEQAVKNWETKIGKVQIVLPPPAHGITDTFRTAGAHILINREGPAFHPGPRRYSRSWIRDGAIMGAALLRMGCPQAMRDFIRWYVSYQGDDGKIPDCAGREGAEWLPEFDAYGEFVYSVVEYYRFTGDKEFLAEMQPAVTKSLAYMEGLRSRRLTEEYETPGKRAFYGLLPESMSHEGYMAHPVHAYWDDFWALRGLRDGVLMAEVLGDEAEASRLAGLRDSFSENVRASLAATMARHGIDFVPGSVELGDFDPTSTAIAIGLLDEAHLLPSIQTANTFDRYLEGFRKRASGAVAWNNYTAYEIRNIGALVRLGRRRDALELMEFMLADRRIPAWNQWPEISWRDLSGPSFIGDLPHTWIGAEYILAICTLFAYERLADDTLIIAAGVAEEWLSDGFEVRVENLPTYFGNISYSLRFDGPGALRLKLGGDLVPPPGGILVKPPMPRPIRRVQVNDLLLPNFESHSFTCTQCPAEVVIDF
jgi:F5/8 type C domain